MNRVLADENLTVGILFLNCSEHDINFAVFGQFLMKDLKKAYFESGMDIIDFADKVYSIWKLLPSSIQMRCL